MTQRQKWSLLAGLFLVWISLIALRLMTTSEPKRIPLAHQSGHRQSQSSERKVSAASKPSARSGYPVSFREPKNIFAPLDRRTTKQAKVSPLRVIAKESKVSAGPMQGPPPPPPEEVAARQALKEQELAVQRIRQEQEMARQRARQQQEQLMQTARQQLAQYRFLGYLQQGGEAQAFLGKGRDIFIVRTGQVLEGRVQVKGIGQVTIQLMDAATNVETTLQLVKDNGNPN